MYNLHFWVPLHIWVFFSFSFTLTSTMQPPPSVSLISDYSDPSFDEYINKVIKDGTLDHLEENALLRIKVRELEEQNLAATQTRVAQEKEEPEEEKQFVQPALVTGGTLKDYQLEGVAWMASLWENGISGILGESLLSDYQKYFLICIFIADEMGLGKVNLAYY